MEKLTNKTVIAKLKEFMYDKSVNSPANVEVALQESVSIDYPNSSIVTQQFIDGLAVYTLDELGLDNGNLNIQFSTNVTSQFFLANCNTEHLLCYTFDGSAITTSTWVKNL